jgi:hypothetical protein
LGAAAASIIRLRAVAGGKAQHNQENGYISHDTTNPVSL